MERRRDHAAVEAARGSRIATIGNCDRRRHAPQARRCRRMLASCASRRRRRLGRRRCGSTLRAAVRRPFRSRSTSHRAPPRRPRRRHDDERRDHAFFERLKLRMLRVVELKIVAHLPRSCRAPRICETCTRGSNIERLQAVGAHKHSRDSQRSPAHLC